MHHSCGERPLLGTVLVRQGVLQSHHVERALCAQIRSGKRLGEILVDLGLLSRQALDRAIARQNGVELEEERGFGTGLRAEMERRARWRDARAWASF